MKRHRMKGVKPFMNPALPNREALHELDKSQHTMMDYMKFSPMTVQPTNTPAPTVLQFAQTGRK